MLSFGAIFGVLLGSPYKFATLFTMGNIIAVAGF